MLGVWSGDPAPCHSLLCALEKTQTSLGLSVKGKGHSWNEKLSTERTRVTQESTREIIVLRNLVRKDLSL